MNKIEKNTCYNNCKNGCYLDSRVLENGKFIEKKVKCSFYEYCADRLKFEIEKLNSQNKELKQKLEKIKEISSVIVYGTHFTNDTEGHLKEIVKDILETIESKP